MTLRRILKSQKADALYSTANFAMDFCPVRQVLLVRNALYFSRICREMFLPKHRLGYRLAFALRRWLIVRSVRAADVVMTPTEAMLDEVRRYVAVKNAVVNPYGILAPKLPENVLHDTAWRSNRADSRVVRLLYVSLYSEHKNLSTLLKALEILNTGAGTKFKLITTADPVWPGAAWAVTHREDIKLARRPGIAEWVEFIGPQSAERTAAPYAAAALLDAGEPRRRDDRQAVGDHDRADEIERVRRRSPRVRLERGGHRAAHLLVLQYRRGQQLRRRRPGRAPAKQQRERGPAGRSHRCSAEAAPGRSICFRRSVIVPK